jgi:hypothetical protein
LETSEAERTHPYLPLSPQVCNVFVDNTIRIFSLDKFSELYSFILPAGVANINLLSEKIFACFYNDQINIGLLHHLALSFYNSKIEVKKIKKIFKSEQDME